MIPIGEQVPRRGNAFSIGLGRMLLWALGWKLTGALPNSPHAILIGAPHTSNMDGVIGIATLSALGIDARTMIKDSAFKGLLGRFLLWAGAIPIRRGSRDGVVEQSIAALKDSPRRWLLIAPEGTRSGAAQWKRGFHLIAAGAGAPIIPVAAHYGKKVVFFGEPLVPTGDFEADLARLLDFYHLHGCAKHPERLSKPLRDRAARP